MHARMHARSSRTRTALCVCFFYRFFSFFYVGQGDGLCWQYGFAKDSRQQTEQQQTKKLQNGMHHWADGDRTNRLRIPRILRILQRANIEHLITVHAVNDC